VSGWHCHSASGLRCHWWPNNQGNEKNQLPRRRCHTNLIAAARHLEGPLNLRPRWQLATSGALRLGGDAITTLVVGVDGSQWPELQYQSPYRFVGDIQTALREQILDVAITERETHIQPNGVPDDRGEKSGGGQTSVLILSFVRFRFGLRRFRVF
jgi:hypothetical protein